MYSSSRDVMVPRLDHIGSFQSLLSWKPSIHFKCELFIRTRLPNHRILFQLKRLSKATYLGIIFLRYDLAAGPCHPSGIITSDGLAGSMHDTVTICFGKRTMRMPLIPPHIDVCTISQFTIFYSLSHAIPPSFNRHLQSKNNHLERRYAAETFAPRCINWNTMAPKENLEHKQCTKCFLKTQAKFHSLNFLISAPLAWKGASRQNSSDFCSMGRGNNSTTP